METWNLCGVDDDWFFFHDAWVSFFQKDVLSSFLHVKALELAKSLSSYDPRWGQLVVVE